MPVTKFDVQSSSPLLLVAIKNRVQFRLVNKVGDELWSPMFISITIFVPDVVPSLFHLALVGNFIPPLPWLRLFGQPQTAVNEYTLHVFSLRPVPCHDTFLTQARSSQMKNSNHTTHEYTLKKIICHSHAKSTVK